MKKARKRLVFRAFSVAEKESFDLSAKVGSLFGSFLQFLFQNIRQDQIGTVFGHVERNCLSDPFGSSCDKGGFVCEVHEKASCFVYFSRPSLVISGTISFAVISEAPWSMQNCTSSSVSAQNI